MQKIISCDWGSSALRLRIIDAEKRSVLAEVVSEQGISAIYNLWKQSGKQEMERLSFYQSILTGQLIKMEEQLGFSLQDEPLVISGMASANIGMMELSYTAMPCSADGHDLHMKTTGATDYFRHEMLVISGIRKDNDVMRGEETQLIGCSDAEGKEDRLFIFPGTHSKHIIVKQGKVMDFNTFMTGEFFELLSKKSILSHAVEESRDISDRGHVENFEKGIADGFHLNILHSSFLVRTNDLFYKLTKQQNYFYLSGLLIGTELKELASGKMPLTVVSDPWLTKLYSIALQKLGVHGVRYCDAGEALVAGHCKMYKLWEQGVLITPNN